jgi:hypothetical protein
MRGVPRERVAQLVRRVVVDRRVENAGRSPHDLLEVRVAVEVQPVDQAEPRAQRRGQQPLAGRGADEREPRERHLDGPGARPLPDHDVELVVLHRGIEDLLDDGRHSVDFVDEEDLALGEVGQDRREIARLLQHRARGRLDGRAQLGRNHVRQRRLAEPGRAVQQHVIERLAATPRSGDGDLQVLPHVRLADVLGERARPETRLVRNVLVRSRAGDQPIVSHRSAGATGASVQRDNSRSA